MKKLNILLYKSDVGAYDLISPSSVYREKLQLNINGGSI